MKIKKSTSGPAPYIVSAIGTVCLSALMGPAAIFTFPLLVALGKIGQARQLDEIAAEDAGRIARQWKETKKTGESRIKISSTIGSGGLLVDLPMTRNWEIILDPEEVKALDQRKKSQFSPPESRATFPDWTADFYPKKPAAITEFPINYSVNPLFHLRNQEDD